MPGDMVGFTTYGRLGEELRVGQKRHWRLGVIAWIGVVSFWTLVMPGSTEPPPPPPSFTSLVERLQTVVVHVSTPDATPRWRSPVERFFQPFAGEQQFAPDTSLASGVIVSTDGYILTSHRALPPGTSLTVTLFNRHTYPAQVVGRDRAIDLALLRIEPTEPLQAAPLGNSQQVQEGEWVLAIGNPFGLGLSVTAGIVSAIGRVLGNGDYDALIQTDAAINPGNAGGPLVNMRGEVVGIVYTAVQQQARRIGFAVPSNAAHTVYTQLRNVGAVMRGYLGVTGQIITETIATAMSMPGNKGVLIVEVQEDSPAAQAGLQRGDVITELAGEPALDPGQIARVVATQGAGARVPMHIWRDGKPVTLTVTLGKLTESPVTVERSISKTPGLRVGDFTPALARQLGISYEAGVIVESVVQNSLAAQVGLQRHDIIVEVNRAPVRESAVFQRLLEEARAPLLLLVKRRTVMHYLVLSLG